MVVIPSLTPITAPPQKKIYIYNKNKKFFQFAIK